MPRPHRQLQTPPGRSGFKIPESGKPIPLIYLGWGKRRFDIHPVAVARNFGYVYMLVLKGTPCFMTDKAQLTLKRGSMVICDIDCPMGWTDRANSNSEILAWIWRDPPAIKRLRPPPRNLVQRKLDSLRLKSIIDIHKESRQELSRLDDYSSYALGYLQSKLDVEILRADENATTKPIERTRYAVAINWMRHNLQAQNPIAELSIYLGVSESTLQRIFKSHTKQSPSATMQSLKAERAVQLTKKGLPIKEIAYQLGYRHANDFTRFYTKTFGKPPSGRRRNEPT